MSKVIRKNKAASLAQVSLNKNKAQTTLEYAVLFICIVAALLAMNVYMKRGLSGKFREIGDELGQQYSPKNTTGTSTFRYNGTTNTIVETKSEEELAKESGKPVDLNANGVFNETAVYGTQSKTWIDKDKPSTTEEYGEENVGPLEDKLF